MATTIFDLEEKRLRREISERGAKVVFIQLPEGLKDEGPRLSAIAKEAGALAIVSADPCYGACDLPLNDAEVLGVELIVHYGHSQMIKQERVPTIYIEARARSGVKEAVEKAIPLLRRWSSTGLITTVQHVHMLNKAKDILLKAGKTVAVGDAGRTKYAGQVIGCDYSNAKSISKDVEAFLFVGGGRFHGLGVALATAKPTIIADPYEKRAYSIHDEAKRVLKQRWASIYEAKKAENIGVLIGLKKGQKKVGKAVKMKEKLQKSGKEAVLLALREITPKTLIQFSTLDAFVNTACPRLCFDDAPNFQKPILTVNETLVALGEIEWKELCIRGLFEDL